jgi:hypothetical protein
MRVRKWLCEDCGWLGAEADLARAEHPFIANDEIHGCPSCGEVTDLAMACDEDGCSRPATCGMPTPEGYRHTCGPHMPSRG